jgi:hypothetical protein
LEVAGDCDVPGAIGAGVAMGAVAPVLMKLPEAVRGRLSRTQPVNSAAVAMTHPVTTWIFISIKLQQPEDWL